MSVIDEDGSARRALAEVVRESGPEMLDDPARLGALLSDLLPTTPREARLIVAAANARVAGQLASRIALGMPAAVAVRDVAAALSDTASLDLTRATWVVAEYAHALGHEDTPAPPIPVPPAPVPLASVPPLSVPPTSAPPVLVPPAPVPPAYLSPVQPSHSDQTVAAPGYSPGYPPVAAPPARGRAGLIGAVAGVLVLLAVLGGVYVVLHRKDKPSAGSAGTGLPGLVDFHNQSPDVLVATHQEGAIAYTMSPPVGGPHNPTWENCQVYADPIPNENAVHSLEHGAVWITYQPGMADDEVAVLAAKVTGTPYMLMSPYPGLTHKVFLQAWGYQLALDDVGDPRIDRFITRFRVTAAPEPGAPCTGGTSGTGTTPNGFD